MMKLKKVKANLYELEIDGEKFKIYDEVILNNNILFKKDIDSELLAKILKENEEYKNYLKVLKYINTKMRSRAEIIKYMNKLELDSNKILKKLEHQNIINDDLFLKAYIADKINLTLIGPYKIKKELLEHQIDEHKIDEELNKIDDSIILERISKIINKKVKLNKKPLYIFKQKVYGDLLNDGYDKEMINECLNKIEIDDSKYIDHDLNIIYRKLQNKFEGENLKYKLKEKLYAKGYNQEMINEAIKKMDI